PSPDPAGPKRSVVAPVGSTFWAWNGPFPERLPASTNVDKAESRAILEDGCWGVQEVTPAKPVAVLNLNIFLAAGSATESWPEESTAIPVGDWNTLTAPDLPRTGGTSRPDRTPAHADTRYQPRRRAYPRRPPRFPVGS